MTVEYCRVLFPTRYELIALMISSYTIEHPEIRKVVSIRSPYFF